VVLRVGVLGPVTAWYGEQELPVGQPRQQAVLGILAMRANRVISRGELVDAVWGQDPPTSAEGGVYTYVAGLRRIIEPNRSLRGPGRVLVSSGAGYVLHLVPGQPDAVSFEQYLTRARQLRKGGDPDGAVTALNSALGLWRGIAFAGVPGPFAETERTRLGELRSAAAEERADVLLALGRHEEVVPDLTAMVADHPLRERMRGLLMIALYRGGRHGEALRVFTEGKRVLAEELGIDPGSELSRINQQILTADTALDLAPQTLEGAAGSHHAALSVGWADATGAADRTGATAAPAADGPAPPLALGAVPVRLGGQSGTALPVPAQLPLEAPGFSGRHEELAMLYAMLPDEAGVEATGPDEAGSVTMGPNDSGSIAAWPAEADSGAGSADSVPIVVISGTAGIGKTALAVRFGHQVAKRFPGGQLYAHLRGLDPAATPVAPGETLRFFLHALGVPPHRIPADTEERAALYRSLLDGQRILIVLDNARNVAQVRPLLPGSPGCLVLITSRNEMTGLVAAEGAMPLTLDVLSYAEAHEMLARRLGHNRAAAEPEAAAEIIEACARLPLALSIAVGRAAGRPKRPLAELAAELRDARGRLDALEADDAATDVRAVMSWSYNQLSPAAARMFRLLGVHPGPDISLSAAASLAALTRAQAGAALRELTRTHMVAEHLPSRFSFHDLLRAYAADQAERHDSETERRAAQLRTLDHYLHTVMAASVRFSPHRKALRMATPQAGVVPADFSAKEQAMAWFDAEAPVLLALIEQAYAEGFDVHAWQIPWALSPFFSRRGRLHEYKASQEIALAAARRLDDQLAQAHAHHLLGQAQSWLEDYDAAEPNARQSLDMFRDLGDRAGEAAVLNGLAVMLERQGRYPDALALALDALRMLKAAGFWWAQGNLENTAGWLYAHLGQFDEALAHCQRALGLHRESGYRGGSGDALDSLGFIYRHLGDHAQSREQYGQAVAIYREIGDHFNEGQSLAALGETYAADGDLAAARAAWRRSLAILDRLPHPLADEIRARLEGLEAGLAAAPSHPDASHPDASHPGPGRLTGAATTAR
jgi:DNA-binding SARP family transcriptional activator/tetratricopeptide (TPR) repeat protein